MAYNTTLRLCYTHIEGFLMFDPDIGEFTGVMGPLVNPFIEYVRGIGIVPVPEQVYGTLVDKEKRLYDGCIGSLQRNESDWGIVQVPMPVFGDNITQGPPLGFEKMSILSGYNPNAIRSKAQIDVMSATNPFSSDVWILIAAQQLLFFVLLVTLSYLCTRIAQQMRSQKGSTTGYSPMMGKWMTRSVWNIVSKSLKQFSLYSMRRSASFIRIFLLTLTLFNFWIHCFMCSMIKTELTVVEPPVTIETYADILTRNITPMWIGCLGDKDLFRYSPLDSIERELWNKAVAMAGDHMENVVLEVGPMGYRYVNMVLNQEAALITGRMTLDSLRKNTCASQMNFLTRATVDKASVEYVRVTVARSAFEPELMRYLYRKVIKMFESGIVDESAKRTGFFFRAPSFELMRRCMSDRVITKEASFDPPKLTHYVPLCTKSLAFMLASLVILMMESLGKKLAQRCC